MSSPLKRALTATTATAASATNGRTSGASEFPPIRARSPKKHGAASSSSSSPSKRQKSNGTSKLPRVSPSSVTFAENGDRQTQVPDSGEELEVLKCILVREGYLQRLAHASAQGKVSGSQLSVTIDVLDLLRIATIEVVESIVAWRTKQQRQHQHHLYNHDQSQQQQPSVFTWNSLNYLLKLASDLDFLERHQGLVQWLGFTLVRNPFVLPVNLDTRAQLEPSLATIGSSNASSYRPRHDQEASSQFVQVGGKRNAVDQGPDATAQWRVAQAAALAERKRAKNPYETRVINDEELVPLARTATRSGSDRPKTSASSASSSMVLPSQIGDLDMTRIRACEQIVLAEEASHGRYTRDIQGQLVPESEAQRRLKMIELSGDAYARHDQSQADNEDRAGAIQKPKSGDETSLETRSESAPLPPRAYAKKRAGMLGPISKPQQRKPVRKSPLDRSRGAHLEETLQQERHANLELALLIDRVREEIERKEMDLAYFESFPGVQLFGGELDEFRKTTRADVALLRRDLTEKQYVYASRSANLDRKAEIIHVFKENRKGAVEVERSTRLRTYQDASVSSPPATQATGNQETQDKTSESSPRPNEELLSTDPSLTSTHKTAGTVMMVKSSLTRPLVHDMCATLIQKIARGKLARAAFEVLKIEYYVGSKYIQALVRGFLARRRVAKMYWQLTASLVLQRFARGLLARRLVARRRHAREMQRAALRIQRVLRGFFGRRRMRRVRRLFAGRQQLLRAADELQLSDLNELADACAATARVPTASRTAKTSHATMPSLVLGLVRVLMVLTTDHDDGVDVCGVRWKQAAQFLRCSARVQRRMSKVASVAATSDRVLRKSLLGTALLDMYRKDREFTEHTFANLDTGWRAATILFRWITAFATVTSEQDVFAALGQRRPFLFSEATDAIEAMLERAEEQENAIYEHAVERRFVPRELVQSAKPRPRAVLLVVAFDVPLAAKQHLLEQLCSSLPGVFVVLNRRNSVVNGDRGYEETPVRIAKTRQQQLDILGADFTSIREALAVGHSAILECDVGLTDATQRRFLGAFTALKAAIAPSPLCILLRGSLRNRSSNGPASVDAMADAEIKHAFERSAEWLHRLGSAECAAEMKRMSTTSVSSDVSSPSTSSSSSSTLIATAFGLVMEAVVILLTPSKRYDAPQPVHTSGVSWRLARRLLANPTFFVEKLQHVAYESITSDNLRALLAYVRHGDWPQPTLTYAARGELLHALASWVESVVACAEKARDCHGLALGITRSTPVAGLFDNVVVYENTQSESVAASLQDLVEAALADVRVYRKVHTLDGRRCVLSVYHDCERVFFSAYDPKSSWRWQRVVPEQDIDVLLAPNSVERGADEAAARNRRPPATREEMYDRLVRLCLLQAASSSSSSAQDSGPQTTHELVVRPPAIRLFRRVLRLGGHRATVTLAELSRGRIQVDVSVHGQSLELRRVVNLEEILDRMSHRESHELFIPPERLPSLVLERLHLFRPHQASPAAPSEPLKLSVRTKESAPGRVLLRKAVRSRWLKGGVSAAVWLFTVLELHSNDQFRVDVYQPQSSQRFSRVVSTRELQDLRLPELCQHPSSSSAPSLLRGILKLLQFETDPEEDHDQDARIVACTLRHHVLTRFPLAIRFVPTRHHVVDKGGVVRAYVQVETEATSKVSAATTVSASTAATTSVRFRVFLPESCAEQQLLWRDAEVESYFAGSAAGLSWTVALRDQRKRMAHELARNALQWDPSTKRVVATLPCGHFVATPCTRAVDRVAGVSSSSSQQAATRSKRSLFTSHSSQSLLPPTPSSCVRLLDFDEVKDTKQQQQQQRVVFLYDHEELVHNGSYRANGVLVVVQVFMKAVIITTSQPRLPVDRTEQHDSFELALQLYHPATSTAQRLVIHGRTKLREVVGPERATLIGSATIHELLEHIVESRTTITLHESTEKEPQKGKGTRTMHAAFVRDRLYAKQKNTPIQQRGSEDAATNKTKLIDAKSDRGLKLLTKARTIPGTSSRTSGGGGKVILSVFDVSHTRSQVRPEDQQQPHNGANLQLRVDAYVCDSCALLSLSLEAADLVHIIDDATALGLLQQSSSDGGNGGGDNDAVRTKREQLASLVIDHVGIECRRDGTPDRLFLVETVVANESSAESVALHNQRATDSKTKAKTGDARVLLCKTVRQIRHVPVVVTLFAVAGKHVEIQCYNTQSSMRTELLIPSETLAKLLTLQEDDWQQLESLDGATTKALLTHVLAFVHFDMALDDKTPTMTIPLDAEPDSDQEKARYAQWLHHNGRADDGFTTTQSWRGLTTAATTTVTVAAGVSTGRELCALHVALQTATTSGDQSQRLLCSALALRKGLLVTRVFPSEQLMTKPAQQLEEWIRRIRIYLHQEQQHQSGDCDTATTTTTAAAACTSWQLAMEWE